MHVKTMGSRVGVAAVAVAWLLAGHAFAQEKVFEPEAKAVLDRYIEVTGGREAYAKLTSRKLTLSLNIVGQGITGTVTMLAKAPNKMSVTQEIAGMGQSVRGFDGTTAWEKSPFMGNRIIEGDELAQIKEQAFFNITLEPDRVFSQIKHAGEATVDGKPAHRIELTNDTGTTVQFYDKESGLLVRQESVVKSPMGELPVSMTFADYKPVDGILIAHTMIQSVGPGTIETKVVAAEHNVEIPDSEFQVPPELKR